MQKIPQSGHTDSQFISLSTLSAFYGDGNRLKIIETDAVKSLVLKDCDILCLKVEQGRYFKCPSYSRVMKERFTTSASHYFKRLLMFNGIRAGNDQGPIL